MASKRRPWPLSSDPSVYAPRGLDRLATLRRLSRSNLIVLVAAATGLVLLAYLLIGQPLLLLLATVVAGGVADGLVRTHPTLRHHTYKDLVLFLLLPILFTLGAGVFFRYTLSGWLQVPAAGLSAAILGAVLYAEYNSVDTSGDHFVAMRLILNLAGYLAAFSLYTALYNQRLPLPLAALLVGLVSLLIGVEILREVDLKTEILVIYGAALGFVMAEARWALNFVSLGGWLGGVFILIIFYVLTQVLQAHLLDRLDRRVALEFSVVGAIGTIFVIAGRVLAHA
ncbi:MAG: DUF5656 family protein [Dehalococcoidia bacterium]